MLLQLDGIHDSATQADIFNQVALGHVEDVLQGYSATLVAYGASGSGKSFSMSGQKSSYPQRGIIPRALAHVFHAAQTSIDRWIDVGISCMEIYNDQMYDLLADIPALAGDLRCQEDEFGKITVKARVFIPLLILDVPVLYLTREMVLNASKDMVT